MCHPIKGKVVNRNHVKYWKKIQDIRESRGTKAQYQVTQLQKTNKTPKNVKLERWKDRSSHEQFQHSVHVVLYVFLLV